MNRIDRLQAILTAMQSKRIITAEALAEKFEVSIRTIYRDIRALEEGGVPIGAEAGIGYYIMEGYHLPPVMFTHEEARVLLMAGKMVEKMTDQRTSQLFGDALTKISSVLDSAKKEELEDLDSKIMVLPTTMQMHEPPDLVLEKIKESLAKSVHVSFDYVSGNRNEESTREVQPLGLCYYAQHWHLIAYCLLRQGYRDFRVDRMSHFKVHNQRFKPSSHPSLRQYLDEWICETPLHKVVVHIKTDTMKYISNTKFHMGFMKESYKGDWCEVEFATLRINYIARWLLSLGDSVRIQEPASLTEEMRELVKELQRHHLGAENSPV